MRVAINAAIISDQGILLVKKGEVWILPGGKPTPGESDIACLCREVGEELSNTKLGNMRFYGEFTGVTPHKGDVLSAKVYFADINGALGPASAEIREVRWVKDKAECPLSDITSKIFASLQKDGYLRGSKQKSRI
ncbi:MAG: NUDIX domain-containing protein [Candidatus Micrarchaeota archaeon]|nr:NUDIX domain-containing protein [Candidatus Micrarchaeota archaeon]